MDMVNELQTLLFPCKAPAKVNEFSKSQRFLAACVGVRVAARLASVLSQRRAPRFGGHLFALQRAAGQCLGRVKRTAADWSALEMMLPLIDEVTDGRC